MPRRLKRSQVRRTARSARRVPRASVRPPNQRNGSAGRSTEPDRILNAFWGRDILTYVVRDDERPGGVRLRTTKAEHSCFVLATDIDQNYASQLQRKPGVRWVRREGDWYRIGFRQREICQAFCKAAKEDGVPTFEGMISPVVRWMSDHGIKVEAPRIAYVDLETDSRVVISKTIEGHARILSWAVVGSDGREFEGCLRSDTDKAERALLVELWKVFDEYDLIAAWNGDRFDFAVIKARSQLHRLLGGGRREWRRWLWLDHLELFRKMNTMAAESGDEKQSMALGNIATALGIGSKLDFDSSKTWTSWFAGGKERRQLRRYNMQDARLMPLIEDKTGYIMLLQTIGQVCGTFADSRGFNPSVQVEGFLQRLAVTRGHRFPTKHRDKKDSKKFEGAFVLHPTRKGIIRDVHVADFSGLYPNIIRTWNMSPETTDCEMTEGDIAVCPLTDTEFNTSVPGLLAVAVTRMMKLRKKWNKKKAAASPGTDEWRDADRMTTAYKIATNSFYGVIGQSVSRFFKRTVAEGVAQNGAWLIQETIKAAEERGMSVIYGDTDSLFVAGATKREFEEFVAWCNSDLYPGMVADVGCKENHIDLAYEKQFDRLVMTTAKRYIGCYKHYKGTKATADSKPEIKGLEYKRGDSVRFARQMQEEVVNLLVGFKQDPSDDPEDFEEVLDRWKDRILDEPVDLTDVMVSQRLGKDLSDYKRRKKKDSEDWARQAPHIEMARVLEARGADVREGSKIEYVVIDGSTKPLTVIPAEDWPGDCDRFALWDALVAPPTLRLLEAAFPDHPWGPWVRTRPQKARKARKAAKKKAA